MPDVRKNSVVVCGGAYGDEGKGRIVDQIVSEFAGRQRVIAYRDNGGANAGHTIEFPDGKRVALHQFPSGVFIPDSTVILGKGMVLHPGDLLLELADIKSAKHEKLLADIMIDEMAVLALDTHRAFESILKQWQTGSKGSTGRGIAPAYADVLLRHPLRMRDLKPFNSDSVTSHYKLYKALVKGLGGNLANTEVPTLNGDVIKVGTLREFKKRLKSQMKVLKPYVRSVDGFIEDAWKDKEKNAFVFEKAQAIGLDSRWGVYPDVTASDTTPAGIYSSTSGVVNPDNIELKIGVIKATYMSSVGVRVLPTLIQGELAERIRKDANEYGATTKRPRDIGYLDLVAIKFFAKVGKLTHIAFTHMDITYEDTPLKICVGYKKTSNEVLFKPDQEYLNTVKPVYKNLKPWSQQLVAKAKNYKQLPKEAKDFLKFASDYLGIPVYMITTGPKREQGFVID